MPQDIFKARSSKTSASTADTSTKKAEKPVTSPAKHSEIPIDIQAQVRDLEAKLSAVQTKLETALAEERIRTDRIQELEEELAASKAEAEQFKANLEAMMSNDNDTPHSLEDDVAKHVLDLEERLFEANQQLEQLALVGNEANAVQGTEERIANLEFDLEYAKEAQSTIRQELDRVQGELAKATEQLTQLTQAQSAQPQADDDTVKQLREKLATAYSKAAEAQSQITDIEMTADERVAKAQEELTAANDKLAELQAEATEAISQNTEAYNAGYAQANVRVQELEAKLADPGQELAEAQQLAAEKLAAKDAELAQSQASNVTAAALHMQMLDKERNRKHNATFAAIVLGLLLLVAGGINIYLALFSGSAEETVVAQPAQSATTPVPEAAKTPSMIRLPMNERNLKLLFGLDNPGCIKGDISPALPGIMSINCKDVKAVYFERRSCTDVTACHISFPAQMANGGNFPATPDNLKALTGQSDPMCYVTNRLSVWGKGKNQLHFECGQYIKDTVRDCWNVSTCRIEVPKNLVK